MEASAGLQQREIQEQLAYVNRINDLEMETCYSGGCPIYG
jgi:hypothetical protein